LAGRRGPSQNMKDFLGDGYRHYIVIFQNFNAKTLASLPLLGPLLHPTGISRSVFGIACSKGVPGFESGTGGTGGACSGGLQKTNIPTHPNTTAISHSPKYIWINFKLGCNSTVERDSEMSTGFGDIRIINHPLPHRKEIQSCFSTTKLIGMRIAMESGYLWFYAEGSRENPAPPTTAAKG
jgi:hypothetical protein